MGYMHYWYREQEIAPETMKRIADDFATIVLKLDDLGVHLADGRGVGAPEISPELVCFNGPEHCGHPKNSEISIPWPKAGAKGVIDGKGEVTGNWFAGALLSSRCCNGDCSYETFYFPQRQPSDSYQTKDADGLTYFNCTKTAYRPYDLAVNAFLVIAKHYLGSKIRVSSDGDLENWIEGIELCRTYLGYEETFEFQNEAGLVPAR
jgi:hypothetical protein